MGLASAGTGFLVLRSQPDAAELLPVGKKGEPLWNTRLPGAPLLPALVLRDKNSPQGKAIVVCTKAPQPAGGEAGTAALIVLAPDTGAVLWRSTLFAQPVAVAADDERLCVSTDDTELTVFDLK